MMMFPMNLWQNESIKLKSLLGVLVNIQNIWSSLVSTPPFSYNMNLDLCFNDEKIKNSKTLPATNPSPHQAKHT